MATSSSAKKAAQVAARSSSSSKKGKNWLFPVAIAAIVILGVAVVWVARDKNLGTGDNDTPPLAQLTEGGAYDHWHSAFAVNVCGTEIGPYSDVTTDLLGIHAHPGEALIHVHPFSLRSAGERAQMRHFFDQVGLEVTDTGFKTPEGDVYSEAETTCGGEPAELTMAYWKDPLESESREPDEILTEDFGTIRFTEDKSAYSLALLPKGEVPEPPAGLTSLINPSDLGTEDSIPVQPDAPTVSTPEGAETTVAGDTETTVAGGTETTAAGATETTAAAEADAASTDGAATETTAAGSGG